MSANRWTDEHGHAWPITGHDCPVCGLPLDTAVLAAGFTDHGENDPEGEC